MACPCLAKKRRKSKITILLCYARYVTLFCLKTKPQVCNGKLQGFVCFVFLLFGGGRGWLLLRELAASELQYRINFKYQIRTVTSLSVCRIAIFTLVWSQSLVHRLYVNHQDTITDVHFVTDLTDNRCIGAFCMAHSGDLIMNRPNVSVQMGFLSELPRALVALKGPLSCVASLVALQKKERSSS